MKTIICLPFCGVLLLFCLNAVTSQRTKCCLKTSNNKISISRVKDYEIQTAGVCPVDAIVLLTIKGKKLCCDPKADWIKEFLTMVDQNKQNCSSTALRNQNARTEKKKKNRDKRCREKKQKGLK